ncbi:MAG: GNAT family N-acetyltransferase [Ichthyobacteriaceae bacterium]|nr:GNAT family N-acetyltransferase [Ichthyobacteriaceae bacterium]
MNKITYKFNDEVNTDELFNLMEKMKKSTSDKFPPENVFHYSLRTVEKEKISLENTVAITARNPLKNNELIGYARLLTDNVYMYYILDVMVNPDYRKLGVGKGLLDLTTKKSIEGGFMKMFLTAIPGSEPFYAKFGFKEGMSPVLTMRGEDYV